MKAITGESEIVQIVEFAKKSKQKDGENLASFHLDVLKDIMKGTEDLPALVVSITGVFRSGKSFLLNLMLTYLSHLSENVSQTQIHVHVHINNNNDKLVILFNKIKSVTESLVETFITKSLHRCPFHTLPAF